MVTKKKIDKDALIELVMSDIKNDIESGDVTEVGELLKSCPTENLLAYLTEELSKTLDIALDPRPTAVSFVQVFLLTNPTDKTRALARVQVYDNMQLTGLRVVAGVHGLFVAYPSDPQYTGDDYRAIYYPLTAVLRDEIEQAVIAKYVELTK